MHQDLQLHHMVCYHQEISKLVHLTQKVRSFCHYVDEVFVIFSLRLVLRLNC